MYQPNLLSVALAVPEIIAIEVLGWGCEPPILGRGGSRGSGMVLFERALHSNFSSIFTRFRDNAAFVLQHSIFPTPRLVSPKFSHVPLLIGGWH